MKTEEALGEITFSFPIVSGKTLDALEAKHARARTDYQTWKRDFLEWLTTEGKNPERLDGYSHHTIRQTSYKIDHAFRWVWNERGYTTEITPDDADKLMRKLGRYSEYADSTLLNIVKSLKRLFSYYNYEKGRNIEWECKVKLTDPGVTNRDYFKQDEFRQLYEASLGYRTVRNYQSCSPEERDRIAAHLAQRFEKAKENITPADFERANCFKFPSIMSVSLDCGLRPIEIKRANVSWVNFRDNTLDIPMKDSSKNKENWKCVLSNRSVRALEKWVNERESYERYTGRDALWLNRQGKRYRSNSLNKVLRNILEETDIQPAGRDLSWYSIRHGVATIWAEEEDIHDAQEQLRHKKVETTIGYAHSGTATRHKRVNEKW